MFRWFVLFVIAVIFISAGCSSIGKVASEVSEVPEWVNGPSVFEKDGYVYGVGVSPKLKNMSTARRVADTRARTQILCFLNEKSMPGVTYAEDDLRLSNVLKFWRDYKSKTTYALVRCRIP